MFQLSHNKPNYKLKKNNLKFYLYITYILSLNNCYTFHTTTKLNIPGSEGNEEVNSNPSNTPSLVDSEESNRSRMSSEEAFNVPPIIFDNPQEIQKKLEGKSEQEIKEYFENIQTEIDVRARIKHDQITQNNTDDHEIIEEERLENSRTLNILKELFEEQMNECNNTDTNPEAELSKKRKHDSSDEDEESLPHKRKANKETPTEYVAELESTEMPPITDSDGGD